MRRCGARGKQHFVYLHKKTRAIHIHAYDPCLIVIGRINHSVWRVRVCDFCFGCFGWRFISSCAIGRRVNLLQRNVRCASLIRLWFYMINGSSSSWYTYFFSVWIVIYIGQYPFFFLPPTEAYSNQIWNSKAFDIEHLHSNRTHCSVNDLSFRIRYKSRTIFFLMWQNEIYFFYFPIPK